MGKQITGIVVAFVLASLLFVPGCSNSESSSGEATDASKQDDSHDRLTLAIIPKQTGGEFWETVEKGSRRAADEFNVELKWEGPLSETEISQQNKIIENMINLQVRRDRTGASQSESNAENSPAGDRRGNPGRHFRFRNRWR